MKYFATKLSDNIGKTPEGYLICLGVSIARTGDYDYADGETPIKAGPSGIVVITRDPEDVFDPKAMASFEGKPLTIQHPDDFVDPENWSELAKGVIKNVRRGSGDTSDDLIADILITDHEAISLVNDGMRELSCGYEAEYIETSAGHGKQTKIVGNHLALVDEGRAGSSYAIKDKKGVNLMSNKVVDKIKAAFGVALDEAMKEDAPPKKEESAKDSSSYDELVKICKDLGEKIDGLKPKSEDADEEKPKKDEPAKDEEEAPGIEDRLKALEEAVAKMLEGQSEDDDGDAEGEESEDDDDMESEDADGDAEEASSIVGDSKSRAEILSPGIKGSKDLKVKALKAAYGTKDGKMVIDKLTGGKPPLFTDKAAMDQLFIAASELMKSNRSSKLASTKTHDQFTSAIFSGDNVMTPEKLNEMNAKRYNLK